MGNAREEEKKMRNKTKTGKRKTSRIVAHGQSVDRERATERAIVKSTLGFFHCFTKGVCFLRPYFVMKKHTNPIAICHF